MIFTARTEKGEKMGRLIDADKVTEAISWLNEYDFVIWHDVMEYINKLPTVDAEPIVRCKDCRWGRKTCGNVECRVDLNAPSEYHGYEWFCPSGERRKDG